MGRDSVFGWIGANARIINDNGTIKTWAGVHATWSYDRPRLNCTEPPKGNITFTFFTAHLSNQSDVSLNNSGDIMRISGIWNVFNVTTTISVDENGELVSFTRTWTHWLSEVPGVLRIPEPPNPQVPLGFVLEIEGMPVLHGFVNRLFMRYTVINIYDLNDDGKVDIMDLVRIARRYHAMPGFPRFDPDVDFNFDCFIDIFDLVAVANNMG